MKKLSVFLFAILLVFGFIGAANASLIDRGGGLIYDSDQNITWLQDANYAQTSGYAYALYGYNFSDGGMLWDDGVGWADGLEYYDSVRNVTWKDWRLPTTVDGLFVMGIDGTTTAGCNITTSEMGYMYYVNLGNLGLFSTDDWTNPQPGWGLYHVGPFMNLQSRDRYSSGTEYSIDTSCAWTFSFKYGTQSADGKDGPLFAWAVRDGDVAPVPIPSAIWLLGSGLIGVVAFRKRFKKEKTK